MIKSEYYINQDAGALLMYTGEERRLHPRYGAENMTASISFQDESSGKTRFEKVHPVDFSVSGITIITNIHLKIGSTISLDLSKESLRASNIIGIVRNVVNQGDKSRYGLEFDFAANDYMCSEKLEETLSNMEHLVKKDHKFPHRNPYPKMTE
jgi:hypothetical protein